MKVPEPRRLPSGSWFIQLRLNGVSVPVTASTAKECKRQAELIKAEHRSNKRVVEASEAKLTVAQAIDRYVKNRENTLSPATVDGYRRIKRNRFQSVMNKPICDVRNWQAVCDEQAKAIAPKTLKNAWGFMASVLRECNLPVPSVTLPTGKSKSRGWLEPEEILKVVKAAEEMGNVVPVCLALSSLRRSEIAALKWEDINFACSTISVCGAVVNSERGFVKKDANKTENSTRVIPIMIPELLSALSDVPKAQRVGKVVRCSPQTICHRINRACRAAGCEEVGTHGLRHSFTSLAYHLGLSEMETMEIGGWKDAGTMRRIYTHLARADRLKAENKMADFYKNANENANAASQCSN